MNSGSLARIADGGLLIAFVRALLSFIFLAGIGSALAQVEPAGAKGPGLHTGIVLGEGRRMGFGEEVSLQRTEGAPVELSDFSLSFVLELEKEYAGDHKADFLWLDGGSNLLTVSVYDSGIHVRMSDLSWDVQASPPLAGRKVPVTLSVKRDPRQALAGLWVDGVEQTSVAVRPGTFRMKAPPVAFGSTLLQGGISQLYLHDRALSRDEILEFAGQATPSARNNLSAFERSLDFMTDETIAVLGGTEAVAIIEDGTLEAMLLAKAPAKRLKMRSLAWETDTAWRQDRPLNFGKLPQQLQRVGATCVLLMFGRQECLERGEAGVQAFRESLGQLVDLCQAHTPRVVLVALPPFETGTPPEPDLKPLNAVLAKYHQAMLDVAATNHLLVVPPIQEAETGIRLTRDGVNLNAEGIRRLSTQVASLVSPAATDTSGLSPDFLAAIRAKNRLWHDYWRPSNWAFLYGDRTAQPSSRDHLNPQVRWFPAELEKSRALIEAKEQEIWRRANEMERRVP
ncbi:MAG: hypothetical protein U0984_02830 [Prosthecobacter sp.]|nr:hypothetical protein [Prosthecobacter sp.]